MSKAELINEPGQRDEKGRFKPGSKIAGRPKGALTHTSKEVRQILTKIIAGNLEQIEADIATLSPKDRISAIIAMANIVLPKLSAVAIGSEGADEIKKQIFMIGNAEIEF